MANSAKILLRGYFGHRNVGDDLLLLEALRKCPEQVELYVLGDEVELEPFQKYRPFTAIHTRREILANNFLMTIFFGGGLFPDRKYGFRQYLATMLSFLTSKAVVMQGVGVVPKVGRSSNFWFRRMINSLDYLSVRDEVSFDYVTGLRIVPKIYNCGDLFWGSPELDPAVRGNGPFEDVLICIAEPFSSDELAVESTSLRYQNFVGVLQDTVAYLIQEGYRAVFIPFSEATDSRIIERICADPRIVNPKVLQPGRDFKLTEIDHIFRSASLGICMRYHSQILAMKNGLPFVGICYDFKSVSLLAEAGLGRVAVKYGIRRNQFFGELIDITFQQMLERIDYVQDNLWAVKEAMSAFSKAKPNSVREDHERVSAVLAAISGVTPPGQGFGKSSN